MTTTTTLNELPDELILHIFRFLDYRWLTTCRLVDKRFRQIAEAETLWKRLTRLDHGADKVLWDCWTFRAFYSEVLHPFRFLPGWWLRDSEIVGGLLHITVDKDGINCYDCMPAVDGRFFANVQRYAGVRILRSDEAAEPLETCIRLTSPDVGNYYKLRKRRIFTISYLGRRLRMFCHQSDLALQDGICHRTCKMCTQASNHDCDLFCSKRNQRFIEKIADGGFKFSCQDQEAHESMDYRYWLEVEHGLQVRSTAALAELVQSLMANEMYYFRTVKFHSLLNAASFSAVPYRVVEHTPLSGALPSDVVLPRAGLYCGTYAVHGLELVECHYEMMDDEAAFVGRKVTGDQNVPVGEVTFTAFLDRRMLLNQDDIACPRNLYRAVLAHQENNFAIGDAVAFRSQPFFDGPPWHWDCPGESFARCCGRYLGEGQIADSGFTASTFSPLVLAAHTDDCFTLSWIELDCISAFFRCDLQPHS